MADNFIFPSAKAIDAMEFWKCNFIASYPIPVATSIGEIAFQNCCKEPEYGDRTIDK